MDVPTHTQKINEIGIALAYADVQIKPRFSEVLPSQVSTETWLTRKIKMKIPLVSAAMDTVTEAETAIDLAKRGGIGVIHKNLSPARQAELVAKVKRSSSGRIVNPVTVAPDDTVDHVRSLIETHKYSGFPVIIDGRQLVGIVTNRDLHVATDGNTLVSQVMIGRSSLVTASEDISTEKARLLMERRRIEKLLIVDNANRLKGLITLKDIKNLGKFPDALMDEKGQLMVGAAIGAGNLDKELDRAKALVEAGVDVLVIDTAHGHSKNVFKMVQAVKAEFPDIQVIAGNVATAEGAEYLIKAGVDAVKVGVGPGSICTTRMVTGVGIPQITAIMECAEVCRRYGIPLIADGGIQQYGDIAKAIVAGASSVMIGSLFAGTDEAPGEKFSVAGQWYKALRGMGSIGAMANGSGDRYFQGDVNDSKKFVPEGVEGKVPCRGPLADVIYQLVGGLRSAMGYTGSECIEVLQTAEFTRVTSAGLAEGHVHGVKVTNEAPNYRAS